MKILRSEVLSECGGVVHGFVHDPEGLNIPKIASEHGLEDIVPVKQVHGNSVFFAGEGEVRENVQADSLVSRLKGVGVGVVTADCVPVLVCFPDSRCICAIHAGWRGTSASAAKVCLEAVCSRYSLSPRDAVAAIGPAIGICCYEVGEDVASRFVSRHGETGGWLREKGGGKFLLDLAELNRLELLDCGILKVDVLDACTCCGDLPSYRKDGKRAGRMISFAGICS